MKLIHKLFLSVILILVFEFSFIGGWNVVKFAHDRTNLIYSAEETFKLATTHQPESFTELYFENHLQLPQIIFLNEKQSLTFTVHNLENRNMTYRYEVNFIDSNKTISLANGSIFLAQDGYRTVDIDFTLRTVSGKAKIQVLLIDQNQSIDFWTEVK